MIEKLEHNRFVTETKVVDKINEVIEVFNKLEEEYNDHYHAHGEMTGNTSLPHRL